MPSYKIDTHVTKEGVQQFRQYTIEADSFEDAHDVVIDAALTERLERIVFLRYETGDFPTSK